MKLATSASLALSLAISGTVLAQTQSGVKTNNPTSVAPGVAAPAPVSGTTTYNPTGSMNATGGAASVTSGPVRSGAVSSEAGAADGELTGMQQLGVAAAVTANPNAGPVLEAAASYIAETDLSLNDQEVLDEVAATTKSEISAFGDAALSKLGSNISSALEQARKTQELDNGVELMNRVMSEDGINTDNVRGACKSRGVGFFVGA